MTIALLGVPYDASSSWRRGAAGAPAAIRRALELAREYSNLDLESGLSLAVPGAWRDAGDVAIGDPGPTRDAITAAVGALLEQGEAPLVLGGDHSITYPVLEAMRARYGPLDVVHLDAHPDLYPEFAGDRFSHACPFARALEGGFIGRLVQLGIRAATAPQRAVAERYHVETVSMTEWGRPGGLFFEAPVYVSLDLDVLDPAFAPGVSHPEPGGLSVREVLDVLHRIHGTVVGADLVEYNPSIERELTGPVCVKLAKELAGLML